MFHVHHANGANREADGHLNQSADPNIDTAVVAPTVPFIHESIFNKTVFRSIVFFVHGSRTHPLFGFTHTHQN